VNVKWRHFAQTPISTQLWKEVFAQNAAISHSRRRIFFDFMHFIQKGYYNFCDWKLETGKEEI
jgi:hypothetical protein